MGNSLLHGYYVERIEEGFGACRCRHETCIIIGLRDATPTEIVMSCARKLGVQLLYIPSCSTSLIQPLDVYGFSAFKMFLRRKYLEQRVTALGGHPEPLAWLWQVSQSPREFFASKSWAHAFQGVGRARDVTLLQSDLREFMDNPMLFPPPVKPTLAEMALVWPQRRRMGYAAGMLF